MAVSCVSLFLSPRPPPPPLSLKPLHPLTGHSFRLSLLFPVTSPSRLSSKRISYFHQNGGRISSFPENFLLSEADRVQNSQEIASTGDDGVSSIISTLLFIAFIGLSVLSIGVIYIAVSDFLQKRQSDKFEKEEAAKKKSGRKGKIVARARAGPRGFGQKNVEEEDD